MLKYPGDFGSVLKNLTDWSGLAKEWGDGDCTILFTRFVSARWPCFYLLNMDGKCH